ncbi:hypothetical protein DH2020_027263 [Rehmannia glutinosa]|uniref:Uncharacterized protein n=1 Tax=Rehmannia glutinosa TaxID=99300 RepID=A0ABR0VWI0_REHGL
MESTAAISLLSMYSTSGLFNESQVDIDSSMEIEKKYDLSGDTFSLHENGATVVLETVDWWGASRGRRNEGSYQVNAKMHEISRDRETGNGKHHLGARSDTREGNNTYDDDHGRTHSLKSESKYFEHNKVLFLPDYEIPNLFNLQIGNLTRNLHQGRLKESLAGKPPSTLEELLSQVEKHIRVEESTKPEPSTKRKVTPPIYGILKDNEHAFNSMARRCRNLVLH